MEIKRKFGFNNGTLARVLPFSDLEIHIVSMETAFEAIFEMNRISAIAFGLKADGDIFDDTYKYLCVYDVKHVEIVSFYRYILCEDSVSIDENDDVVATLATGKFYNFHHDFIFYKLNYAIELGRSVVNKDSIYEKATGKGLAAIWSGLGILLYEYNLKYIQDGKDPMIKYFFGKWSIQANDYCIDSRDKILSMFYQHFSPPLPLEPWPEVKDQFAISSLRLKGIDLKSDVFNKDKKILNKILADRGEPEPKLAYTYASLGGITVFCPIWNKHLNSWEMLMLQDMSQIADKYINRFIGNYQTINPSLFKN